MATKKLSTAELLRRVDAGDSYADIAKDHGITRQAVYKRVRELRGKTTKATAVAKVEKICDQKIDAMQQLIDINERAHQIIDDADGDPDLALKAMGEVRQQLRLMLDLYATLYDLAAVQTFMDEVLDTIGEIDADARKKIIHKLNGRRSIREAVRFI